MRSFNRRILPSRFGSHEEFNISLPSDADGYTGRECPNCGNYFKIMFGTGLKDIEKCYCPYCGGHEHQSQFHTAAQIEYAKSVVVNKVTRRVNSRLDNMARDFNRRNRHGRGLLKLSMDVKTSSVRIRYPTESELETNVLCSSCTLKYAVYGVYGFCPDCGRHNVQQFLHTNLQIATRMLELRETVETSLSDTLIANALTSVVAALDGFGREVCRAFASKSSNPPKAEEIRFQNLERVQTQVKALFGFDIASSIPSSYWETAKRCFQKRHLLEHKSGVVDEEYLAQSNDQSARLGRKIALTASEVEELISIVRRLGEHIFSEMENLP